MRWVVLTPTFAAGLGIVVAAAMAAPTRSVVLRLKPYSGPCQVRGCGATSGPGTLATRPGTKRLPSPAPVPATQAATGQHAAASHDVLVQYRTVRQNPGSFVGQLTLAIRTAKLLRTWALQFSYYPGQITVLGSSQPPGQQSVTITAGQYHYGSWAGGRVVQIVFSVSGQAEAGPPRGCTLNGQRCHYTSFGGHALGGYGNDSGSGTGYAGAGGGSGTGYARAGSRSGGGGYGGYGG